MAIDAILVPIAEAAIAVVTLIAEILWRPIAASARPFRYAFSASYKHRIQLELEERGRLYRWGYFWWGPAFLVTVAVTVSVIVYWATADPSSLDSCANLQWNQALECGLEMVDKIQK